MSHLPPIGRPAPGVPAQDEGSSPGDASRCSPSWRQAFEQACQADYADWFGSASPAPAAAVRTRAPSIPASAAPVPAHTESVPVSPQALLTASLRQVLRSPAPARASAGTAVAIDAPAPALATDPTSAGAGAALASPDAPPSPSAAPAEPSHRAVVTAIGGAAASGEPGSENAASVAAPVEAVAITPVVAMPPVADAGNWLVRAAIAGAPVEAATTTLTAATSRALPMSPTLAEPVPADVPFAADVQELTERQAPAAEKESAAAVARMQGLATTDRSDDAPRVHAEWSSAGLTVWLGMSDELAAPAQLDALLTQLQPLLAAHGEPLAELFCNGRSVWRASNRDDDPAATQRPKLAELVSLISDPALQEAR